MDGVLVVDKPAGPTSHDIVDRVRRALGTRRVGHTGTLDPFATGVLPVCVGRATRLARFLSGGEKEYLATVRLGFATTTDDLTGEPLGAPVAVRGDARRSWPPRSRRSWARSTRCRPRSRRGTCAGRRLVRAGAAGRGRRRARPRRSRCTPSSSCPATAETVELAVRCSPGTYVRALARDLGERLGTGAHLTALRRTRSGAFDLSQAVAGDDLAGAAERLIPMAGLLLGPARGDGGRGGPAPRRPRARAGPRGRRSRASPRARSTGCGSSTRGASCWPSRCPAASRRARRGSPGCPSSTPTSCSWPRPNRRCRKHAKDAARGGQRRRGRGYTEIDCLPCARAVKRSVEMRLSASRFVGLTLVGFGALALNVCGGGGSSPSGPAQPTAPPVATPTPGSPRRIPCSPRAAPSCPWAHLTPSCKTDTPDFQSRRGRGHPHAAAGAAADLRGRPGPQRRRLLRRAHQDPRPQGALCRHRGRRAGRREVRLLQRAVRRALGEERGALRAGELPRDLLPLGRSDSDPGACPRSRRAVRWRPAARSRAGGSRRASTTATSRRPSRRS